MNELDDFGAVYAAYVKANRSAADRRLLEMAGWATPPSAKEATRHITITIFITSP